MSLKRFLWTSHALLRLGQRQLAQSDVEQAIRAKHDGRQVNEGSADWLVEGITALGVPFAVIYDQPAGEDETTARVVSVWRTD
jgi:hypothetical protein